MPSPEALRSLRRAISLFNGTPPRPRLKAHCPQTASRGFTTTRRNYDDHEAQTRSDFVAAPPIQLRDDSLPLLKRVRVVPESPSYFTGRPTFTDDLLSLSALLRKHATLPTQPAAAAPRVAWKTLEEYNTTAEQVRSGSYAKLVRVLKRLNQIAAGVMPSEVTAALARFKRDVQPAALAARPAEVDEHGRARAVGRRKSSKALVWLVEGDGDVRVNGRSLTRYFDRLHHRESAIWALKSTDRVDKYNVFALVKGGGVTGQAEALTLAIGKALLVHEPALKPALRRGTFFSLSRTAGHFGAIAASLHLRDLGFAGCHFGQHLMALKTRKTAERLIYNWLGFRSFCHLCALPMFRWHDLLPV